jgi:hypothetical protein
MRPHPNGFATQNLAFARTLVRNIIIDLDPSLFVLTPGFSTITMRYGTESDNPFDLMMVPQNKAMDIVIYMSVPKEKREDIFAIDVEEEDREPEVRDRSLNLKTMQVAAIFMTYIMHGSLNGLAMSKPRVPNFINGVRSLDSRVYGIKTICSFPNAEKATFAGLHEHVIEIMLLAPETMQSRALKGLAGNRHLAIARHFMQEVSQVRVQYEQVALLFSPTVQQGHPYVSLLPEHSANPMANTSQNLLRALGAQIKAAGVRMTRSRLQTLDPGLFIDPVVDTLLMGYTGGGTDLPNARKLRNALEPKYSLRAALE